MSDSVSLGIFVAFSAGLLSFLSPCVLPLVPSYIGFLTGMMAPDAVQRRRVTVTHALFFVLGFTAAATIAACSSLCCSSEPSAGDERSGRFSSLALLSCMAVRRFCSRGLGSPERMTSVIGHTWCWSWYG